MLQLDQTELAFLPSPTGICFKKFSLDSDCKLKDNKFALFIAEFNFFDKLKEIEKTGVHNSMKQNEK